MARTAPVPDIPPIPGMNPGTVIAGGGGAGGGDGDGSGNGGDGSAGAGGETGGDDAGADGQGAKGCGPGSGATGCPYHHEGSGGKLAAGDPVDVVTGRVFTHPSRDLLLFGPLPLEITRAYSSTSSERDVGLGFGWSHSLAWEVELRDRTATVWTSDGTAVDFGQIAVGGDAVGPDAWVLVRNESGFVLDSGDGLWRVFQRIGSRHLLAFVRDVHGNTITLEYKGTDLVRVVDSVGRIVRVVRRDRSRIVAIEACPDPAHSPFVRFAQYDYDELGNLVRAIDADGYHTRYVYEDHLLTSYTGPTGLTFFFRYDSKGRCIETWAAPDRSLDADAPKRLADGTTRAKGLYHCKLEYGSQRYSEVADSMRVQRYFGNANGKVDKAVSGGNVFNRTYDDRGFLVSFTDALGATTHWKRDARGRILYECDPLGRTSVFERDADGNIRRYFDPAGGLTEIWRTPGNLTWKDPIGAVFVVQFDGRGLITQTIAPNGGVTTYAYDVHGNMIRKTNAAGAATEYAYDPWGRCVSVQNADGAVTRYDYDRRGNLLSSSRTDGSSVRYEYDGAGDLVGITDEEGAATKILRGGFGKVCEIRKPNGSVTRFTYDREGRLLKVRNNRGDVHSFEQNAAGLVIREKTFDGRELRYRYDGAGRLTTSENALRHQTEYVYDLAGQLIERRYHDDTADTFQYDARGDLARTTTSSGDEYVYIRNRVGWVTKETQTVRGETTSVEREYDLMGDVVRRRTSLGHVTAWERDVMGRNRRVLLDDDSEVAVAHDPLGRELCRSLRGGGRIETEYDVRGRIVTRRAGQGSKKAPTKPSTTPPFVGT